MIFINDREYAFVETNLSDLLISIGAPVEKGVAVAVNNKVIARAAWPQFIVKDNDRIILIKATQGG